MNQNPDPDRLAGPDAGSEGGFRPGIRLFGGRYTLRRFLGRGGMGLVWLAGDNELEAERALKFIPDVVREDSEDLRHLRRETRRSQELTHPHIVRIYDLVKDDRHAAIAMEFIDGPTLKAARAGRPDAVFEVGELREWVRQICDGLHYAHNEMKIVHRDLKPLNLMLTCRGTIKITDFGIAQVISESVSRLTMCRMENSGTLAFMSPQQAMGEAPRVTDDIYALGATLFDLLTGTPPFFRGEIMYQLLHAKAPGIAERRRELGVGCAPVPPEWEETIAACLDKMAEARPQSVEEVVERLGLGIVPGALRPSPGTAPGSPCDPDLEVTLPDAQSPRPENNAPTPPVPAGGTHPDAFLRAIPLKPALASVAGILLACAFGMGLIRCGARSGSPPDGGSVSKKSGGQDMALQRAISGARAAEEREDWPEAKRLWEEALALDPDNGGVRALLLGINERVTAARGSVAVNTRPEGATVMIDGRDALTSPARFHNVVAGTRLVRITHEGYEPAEMEVEVVGDMFHDLGTVELRRATGTLRLTSDPSGAEVTVGGEVVGKTPCSAILPTGPQEVVLRLADYPPEIRSLEIDGDGTQDVAVDFARRHVIDEASRVAAGPSPEQSALRTLKLLPPAAAAGLIQVRAKDVKRIPEQWIFLSRRPGVEGQFLESCVVDGRTIFERQVNGFPNGDGIQNPRPLPLDEIEVDSDDAYQKARGYARASGAPVSSQVTYLLCEDFPERTEPVGDSSSAASETAGERRVVWHLGWVSNGEVLGEVVINAKTGAVESYSGFRKPQRRTSHPAKTKEQRSMLQRFGDLFKRERAR
jgi:serine/threonine protein kinase